MVGRASVLCAIGIALMIIVPAALRGPWNLSRDEVNFLAFLVLPASYVAATTLAVIAIGALGRDAIASRAPARSPRVFLFVVGISLALSLPYAVVVAEGETASVYWWVVYFGYLPGAAAIGGHVAILGGAFELRHIGPPVWPFSEIAVAGAAGVLLLLHTLLEGFNPEYVLPVALALSGLALAFDVLTFLGCRRILGGA